MKQLTLYGLALLLVVGTSAVLASGKHHNGYQRGYHGNHYRQQHYKPQHYGRHHYYRPHHYGRHYFGRHYRHGYYPSYLGAALVGSALTYSLYHTHQGAACYQDHSRDGYRDRDRDRRNSEVVGCHRIEHLPDGSERRVDVPLSECN
jgi:hypothetical protein